jgi:hypothetical protein
VVCAVICTVMCTVPLAQFPHSIWDVNSWNLPTGQCVQVACAPIENVPEYSEYSDKYSGGYSDEYGKEYSDQYSDQYSIDHRHKYSQ